MTFNITRRDWSGHTAHLEPITGQGLLVLPRAADDLVLGMDSLHSGEWAAVVRDLDAQGWEPSEDEDGGIVVDGHTRDGCVVVGLYGRQPITSSPSLDEYAAASAALREAAGIVD